MADFERFLAAFKVTARAGTPSWQDAGQAGWSGLMGSHGGSTFEQGLYRLHTSASSESAREDLSDGFPELRRGIDLFGYDWLGRQFGTRRQAPVPVLMFDLGSGDVLEIPVTFVEFHDAELVDYRDAALASDFFASWTSGHPETIPLAFDQCVGYRIPLFLGGRDDLDNLEVTDLSVYLSLSAQLWGQVRAK